MTLWPYGTVEWSSKKKVGCVPAFLPEEQITCFLTCNLRSDWVLNIVQFTDSVPIYAHVCSCHMVFSVLNELLTSCQLSMQIREPAIGKWLCLELESATLECYEINHSCFNSCLYPCVSCHVWVFFHYNTYHIRKALWEFWRYLERSLPKSFITFNLAYMSFCTQGCFSISDSLGTVHPSAEKLAAIPELMWRGRCPSLGSRSREIVVRPALGGGKSSKDVTGGVPRRRSPPLAPAR